MQFGREQQIPAKSPDGSERLYTLSRLKVRHVLDFGVWVAKKIGDPFAPLFALIERFAGKVSDAALQAILKPYEKDARDTAKQLQQFSMMCPLFQDFMKTQDGQAEWFRLLLDEHHKGIDTEEAFAVALSFGEQKKDEVREQLRTKIHAKGNGTMTPEAEEELLSKAVADAFDQLMKTATGELPNQEAPGPV